MSAISARADLTLAAGKTAGIRMRLCKSTMFALCAILAMLRLIDITAQAADPDKMHFRVVNSETLKPVSNARLTVIWTTNFPDRTTNVVTTDDLGTCLLPIYRVATREWGCSIEVFKDGNVPKYVSWSERQGDEPNDIPQEYMTKLAPGVSIGAVVVNESGEPVPDARVVFDVFGYQAPARSLDRERLTMTSHYHVETADDHGRWHCSHVPAEFGMIRFKVAHPEYAPRDFGSAALGPTTNHGVAYLAQAELRNATAVMPLAQGAIAAGIVVDESDRPVAGAKVTLSQQWAEPTANQISGPDGRFRFANIARETQLASENSICFLTVQAEGYGPSDFQFKGSTPPAESRLNVTKGAELRGRVVDDHGEPVPRASIQICSHSNVRRFEWTTATDSDGRFKWESAPARAEFYIVEAPGFQPMSEFKWIPDGTEHLVTLHTNPPPVLITGDVVDDLTGIPVDNFQVWMSFVENRYTGYSHPMASPRPQRLRAVGAAGQFIFTNKDPFISYELQVRADGYSPAERKGQEPMTNDCRFEFRLEPASSLNGEVRLPDGKPASGATVMLMREREAVYMRLPGQFDLSLSGARHVQADAQGKFSFPPASGAKAFLASAAEGFASVTPKELAASPTIKLQPWGRVAGQLKIGNQAGSNQAIDLSYMSGFKPNGYSVFLETKTDAEGRFVFEGVPPWFLQVAHRLNFREGQPGPIPQSQLTPVEVQAGQTSFVALGGTGYKVAGKIVFNGSTGPIDWQSDVQTLATKFPGQPKPAGGHISQTAFMRWVDDQQAFLDSEAGHKALLRRRSYVLVFDPDGSFKIDDVAPGTYELKIQVSDKSKPTPGPVGFHQKMASLTREVTIPELGPGEEHGSIDLGVFELK